jgi:glutathione S-transferase
MVQLIDQDIQTREVLEWKGLHLFHFLASSCSQKTRIVLNLKGIPWKSHPIDLGKSEHFTPWYLGINPRGLVPTLVIDGNVHIESNDIIQLLDQKFPETKLIPEGFENQMSELLHHEDSLHLDLRTLTFRFTQPRGKDPRSPEDLKNYREGGSGTVQGKADPHKDTEIEFWETAAGNGITDKAVEISAGRFKAALDDLDQKLADAPYLLGESISILDIAWVIYANRLVRCGYPLERLHPRVNTWFWPMRERPEIIKEISVPPEVQKAVEANHKMQQETGTTLVDIAGL